MEQFEQKPVPADIQSQIGTVPSGKNLQGEIGALSSLNTTEKGSLVGAVNELNSNIAKYHYYKQTITTKVHTTDGNLFRSSEKFVPVNSSNIAFASVTVVTTNAQAWANVTKIESNKVYYTIESTEDIATDTEFTIYTMTVDA